MAYRYGKCGQITLLPQSIEEYIQEDDPVPAYDAFLKAFELDKLRVEIKPNKVDTAGNSSLVGEEFIIPVHTV